MDLSREALPVFTDPDAFDRWRNEPARWLAIALDIARGHGILSETPHVFATGTNLVVGLDARLILKIFPPLLRAQFVAERGTLAHLAGRIRTPIPEIVAEGERDGWPWLIITRLAGVLGSEVWPELAEAQKQRVLRQIGETIAEVQAAPLGPLIDLEPRWDAFMRKQVADCRERHQRLGLAAKFLDGFDGLLRDAEALIPKHAPPVILTGEYIPQNFMMACRHDEWSVAGLFDFGDVRAGWRDYDLLGPSAFMAAGNAARMRSLFDGFGYSRTEVTFTLKRRLMALMLLHHASDPVRHICIPDWQEKADDLVQLQELIWPD